MTAFATIGATTLHFESALQIVFCVQLAAAVLWLFRRPLSTLEQRGLLFSHQDD
jgi:hypothetical protein